MSSVFGEYFIISSNIHERLARGHLKLWKKRMLMGSLQDYKKSSHIWS